MAGVATPEAGGAIENGAARHVVIMHVLGAGDHPRTLLEGAVGGEAHPERFKIVGRGFPGFGVTMDLRLVH